MIRCKTSRCVKCSQIVYMLHLRRNDSDDMVGYICIDIESCKANEERKRNQKSRPMT